MTTATPTVTHARPTTAPSFPAVGSALSPTPLPLPEGPPPLTIDPQLETITEMLEGMLHEQSLIRFWEVPKLQDAHRHMANRYLAGLPEFTEADYGQGDAIITAGGGAKYFPSLWVLLKQLKEVECHLPIEVWYLGQGEMDPYMQRLVRSFPGTELYDAREIEKGNRFRCLAGWELKAFAMLNSKRRRVLFLDADNAPVRNPRVLFETKQFLTAGTVFWPDYPHWMLKKPAYDVFDCPAPLNTDPPGDDFDMFNKPILPDAGWDLPIESGQLLVDKSRAYRALALAGWYCQHSDFYFRHVHGDKECFHLAWRKLGVPYAVPMYWPGWDSHTCLQFDFDGNIIFCHRNNPHDKWMLTGNTRSRGSIPNERLCFQHIEDLKAVWSGEVWFNARPSDQEAAFARTLEGASFFYYRKGKDARLLGFGRNGIITQGHAEHEKKWSAWEIDGEMHLAVIGKDGLTFLLKREGPHWKGNWQFGEKCAVTLIDTREVK